MNDFMISLVVVVCVAIAIVIMWEMYWNSIEHSEFISDCRNLSESLEAFDFDVEGGICILTFCGNGTEINSRTFIDECYTKQYRELIP